MDDLIKPGADKNPTNISAAKGKVPDQKSSEKQQQSAVGKPARSNGAEDTIVRDWKRPAAIGRR